MMWLRDIIKMAVITYQKLKIFAVAYLPLVNFLTVLSCHSRMRPFLQMKKNVSFTHVPKATKPFRTSYENKHTVQRFVLIHSFIPAISIASLQVIYYSEALPTTARKRTGNCR